MNSQRLLTVDQVADRLQIHPVTVRKWIGQGRLPAIRLGRAIRVRPADVRRFSENY